MKENGMKMSCHIFRNKSVDLKISYSEFGVTLLEDTIYELLMINLENGKLLIAEIYRSPNSSAEFFTEKLTQYRVLAAEKHLHALMGGDLNINLLERSNSTMNFKNLIKSYGFTKNSYSCNKGVK